MKEETEYRTINNETWLTIKGDHAFDSVLEGWPASQAAYYKYVVDFNIVVQAGGYCGIFPHKHSEAFSLVYTFEPDPLNFYCLAANCTRENVIKAQGALGNDNEPISLIRQNVNNRGMISVREKGLIPKYRIDDLHLPTCDLIQLDVEGYEFNILQGAANTISKYKPVIAVEDTTYQISDFLASMGYKQVDTVHRDTVYAI